MAKEEGRSVGDTDGTKLHMDAEEQAKKNLTKSKDSKTKPSTDIRKWGRN